MSEQFIYVMATDEPGIVKIGFSNAPPRRKMELGRAFKVLHVSKGFPNGREIERAVHFLLSVKRCAGNGERFTASVDEIVEAIDKAEALVPQGAEFTLPDQDQELFSSDEIAALVRHQISTGMFTQSTLAKKLGVSRSYFNEFLHGKRNAGPDLLEALGYDPMPNYIKLEP